MDYFYLFSIIASFLGSEGKSLIDKYTEADNIGLEVVSQDLRNALEKVRQKGDDKLQSLLNQISGLDIIKKSPLLTEVSNKYRKELAQEIKNLRNDISEIDIAGVEFENALDREKEKSLSDRLYDEVSGLKQNDLNKARSKLNEKIAKFEERL